MLTAEDLVIRDENIDNGYICNGIMQGESSSQIISNKILESIKNDECVWTCEHDKVYVKIHTPMVLKYEFHKISGRDKIYYSVRYQIEYISEEVEDIYDSFGIQTTPETIYYNMSDADLEIFNEQFKQYGFELLILSAKPDYKEKIKLNAHAILRVI